MAPEAKVAEIELSVSPLTVTVTVKVVPTDSVVNLLLTQVKDVMLALVTVQTVPS
jgi:hypothetical protein